MAMMNDAIDVGTGDVFKDLGFADAQERKLRTELAMRLNDLIKRGDIKANVRLQPGDVIIIPESMF